MVFGSNKEQDYIYILGCPRQDGTIAILCKTSGSNPGPAISHSKKEAVILKTRLANDPRGMGNHRALEIIKNLYIYKLAAPLQAAWEPGSLWAYLPATAAQCVESQAW